MSEMKAAAQWLQQTLRHEIPLTGAIGLRVVAWDGESLTLGAPLAPNTNHKQTAFGGSLYSVAVLAGWGMLQLKLREQGLDGVVVIHESRVSYRLPVQGDFTATCRIDEPQALERALTLFRRRGRARLALRVTIGEPGGDIAMELEGRYVVRR